MHPTVRCMEKICPWNDLIGVYQPQCVQRERPSTRNACSQLMNSPDRDSRSIPGTKYPSKSRWKTLTSGFAPQQQMLGGYYPAPPIKHQIRNSINGVMSADCHPEVGQWLIYMIAGTWLESNTFVKGPDADFISDSGDPHPLCVTKVGHWVGYLRQRFKIRGVSHEAF